MNALDLLNLLRREDILIRREGEHLQISAPKGTLTPDLKKLLGKHKTQLLEFLTEAVVKKNVDAESAIRPVSRNQPLPLSWSQQRLWLLDQLEPGSAAYNIAIHLRITGRLDIIALENALREIIRRHEILRTTIKVANDEPFQIVQPPQDNPMIFIDLQPIDDEANLEAQVRSLARQETNNPFDLQKGPLFRMRLVRLKKTEHALLITLHHSVFDGWSTGVFFGELSILYNAFQKGNHSPLKELTVQYADYAYWERENLKGDVFERHLNYWRRELADDLPVVNLPLDRPRPRRQTYCGKSASSEIKHSITDKLKHLSNKNGVTLFMTLLSAFYTILFRHTGDPDILIGTPIANRRRTEIEPLIGFFLNTLVLRARIGQNMTFRQLLDQVREKTLNAYSHQELPFERLLEEIQPKRDMSRSPLFQVMFVLQNAPFKPTELNGLTLEPLDADSEVTKFDLTLYVWEQADALRLTALYNVDLFDPDCIEMMLKQYQYLLNQIVEDPDKQITAYSLLSDAQRKQIQRLRNPIFPTNVFTEFLKGEIEQSIAKRFEAQLEKHPQKIAVKTFRHEWTYEYLNQVANHVANRLAERCGGKPRRVGLLLEQDAPMVASIIGTLKAGNTYVPLDPTYPVQRLAYIIEDSQTGLLLTNDLNISLAKELTGESVVLINIDDIDFSEKIANPDIYAEPDRLAYILYTSGSTGRPKGIMQNHRNVLHFIRVYTNSLHISHEDRLTLVSSYSFDAAVMDIYGALLNGATLYPVNIKEEGIIGLPSWLVEQKVTIYHSTPTVYRAFIDTLTDSDLFPHMRLVVLGGEAVYKRDVDSYKRHFGRHCLFVNGLGPTESTVSIQYFLDKQSEIQRSRVPIGYAVEDTEILLLNRYGTYDDVYGEIAIRSTNVALGYWNKSEETEKSFLPDPDGGTRRIYLTGDLGRWLPNGSLEFVGRKDFQVKIRGYRIETAEIENYLLEHPKIKNVSVITKEINGESRLVAYIVVHRVQALDDLNLRQFLKERLPSYMIPSAFVKLDYLPLTPTKKIDRNQLKLLEVIIDKTLSTDCVAPRTEVEQKIASIWQEVLGREKVGIHDNFFELGGHSLIAVQMISHIRRVLDVELPLRSLFENPTVAGLTATIEQEKGMPAAVHLPKVVPVSREERLLLSFAQERLWFLHQLEPESVAYSMPGTLRLHGALDIEALSGAFDELGRRHETLRTSFRVVDGLPEQVIAPKLSFSPEVIDLRHLPQNESEAELVRLTETEARRPFDLKLGPLFRVSLYRIAEEDHVLHVNMHHTISDYWSFGIMSREFAALYKAFAAGETPQLPDLPVQYVDFAYSQRQWLQGEVLQAHVGYWKKKLGGELAVLDLPADRARPAVRTHRGATRSLEISKTLLQGLLRLSRGKGVSLFMVLLAAFKVLLHRHSGQEDIIVGTPIAGRNRRELENLIGFFINTIVMRTDLSGNPGFDELIVRVRDTAFGAYAHQEMPFEKLVEELSPARDLSRTPIFQVFFNHIRMDESRFELPGLELEIAGGIERESKFDMTLYVWEQTDTIRLTALYNADLFDADRIEMMLEQYQELLKQVTVKPEERIACYSLLTPSQIKRIPDPTDPLVPQWCGPVHERFSEQALHGPENPAVVDAWGQWSYGELERYSNQLAGHLRLKGIQPGDVIAIYGHRSAGLVLSLLGILKAGAAFLILDPIYPIARLIKIRQTVQPAGLLLLEAVGEAGGKVNEIINDYRFKCQLIISRSKTALEKSLSGLPSTAPAVSVKPEDMAYLIFTSGTTGEPKGIIGTHEPLSHFMDWHTRMFGLKESDRFSMLSGLSHDPLLRDIFTPLWLGAKLCIPKQEEILIPERFRYWMREQGVTVSHMTPALSQVLTEGFRETNPGEETLSALQHIFFGGDVLNGENVKRTRRVAPGVECVNFYGTTETPQAMGYHVVGTNAGDGFDRCIPLGRGIEGAQLLILNPAGRLTGIGELGEIYVRSPYLARGYLNDNDLTDAKYIENPYTNAAGDRYYRTGDLGRYMPDGAVMFYGRRDRQLKVRGFRVELGEIEANIKEMNAVSNCVVILPEGGRGEQQLVAYCVSKPGHNVATPDFKRYLGNRLPEYMVPQHYVKLAAIPLTPNGKVDHGKLPVPEEKRLGMSPPRTLLETQLVAIWENVLGVSGIGLTDNFFDLGGHSLLGIQLLTQMEKVFNRQFPLSSLFQAQTVEEMVMAMVKDSFEFGGSLVVIQSGGSRPPLFVIPGFWGIALGFGELARHLGAQQPVYCLQSLGLDGNEGPLDRMEDIANHFVGEIRKIQPTGPYHFVGLCWGGAVAFEIAQQLTGEGQSVATLAMIQTFAPGDGSVTYRIPSVFHQLKFAIQGILRHLGSFKDIDPKKWLVHLREKCRIAKEMAKTRDLYRGDRSPLYLNLVQNANLRAFSRYSPQSYQGTILFIMPANRDIKDRKDPRLYWENLAEQGVKYLKLEGEDSGSLLRNPNVQELADILAKHLGNTGGCS